MSRKKGFKSVGELMGGALEGLGVGNMVEEKRMIEEWERVVGEKVAGRSRARKIVRGVLFVEVENSVWMQEIRFQKDRIIDRIRGMFPEVKVEDIRLELKRERGEE